MSNSHILPKPKLISQGADDRYMQKGPRLAHAAGIVDSNQQYFLCNRNHQSIRECRQRKAYYLIHFALSGARSALLDECSRRATWMKTQSIQVRCASTAGQKNTIPPLSARIFFYSSVLSGVKRSRRTGLIQIHSILATALTCKRRLGGIQCEDLM